MVLVGEEMIIQQWKVGDEEPFRCKFNYIIDSNRYFGSNMYVYITRSNHEVHKDLQSNFKLTLKGYNGKFKDRLLNTTN